MLETCISFQMEQSFFYTPITNIKEIVEIKQITPFPIKIPKYIGMINVRGNLLNILCPYCDGNDPDNPCCELSSIYQNKKNKILICLANNYDNSCFGIVGQTIHKCMVEIKNNDFTSKMENIEINKIPYTFFDPKTFILQKGEQI